MVSFFRDVPHDAKTPAFYQRDVTFTKLVVDDEVTISHFGSKGQKYTIYYAGTSDGRIFKVARWYNSNAYQYESQLLDIIDATSPEPIRAMAISKKFKTLYVTSDSLIKQISLKSACTKRDELILHQNILVFDFHKIRIIEIVHYYFSLHSKL